LYFTEKRLNKLEELNFPPTILRALKPLIVLWVMVFFSHAVYDGRHSFPRPSDTKEFPNQVNVYKFSVQESANSSIQQANHTKCYRNWLFRKKSPISFHEIVVVLMLARAKEDKLVGFSLQYPCSYALELYFCFGEI
jgi:hypothetical protein